MSIPKISFSGLIPGTSGWDTVEAEVMKALETYGCFQPLYDGVTPELREALFTRAMPEVLSLPTEVKKLSKSSDLPYQGYIAYGGIESVIFVEDELEETTKVMWPQGNPSFRDAVSAYMNHMKVLERNIARMVFRGLGVEKYYDSYVEFAEYTIRVSGYEAPLGEEDQLVMGAHVDTNLFTMMCQSEAEGLEIQTREGEWIRAAPNSYTIGPGEAIQACSNGRLQPMVHRVRLLGNKKRNSLLFGSTPRLGYVIKAPEKLVDDMHPLLYKPYTYGEYVKARFSGTEICSLKDFCGVGGEKL